MSDDVIINHISYNIFMYIVLLIKYYYSIMIIEGQNLKYNIMVIPLSHEEHARSIAKLKDNPRMLLTRPMLRFYEYGEVLSSKYRAVSI